MNPTHILWIDLETTTTDPRHAHAAVLEVGAIVTRHDAELTEVGRASMLIRPAGLQSDHDKMWSRMVPFVQQMHAESGLWAEATTGDDAWGPAEADSELAGWVDDVVAGDGGVGPVPLAGSGVAHLDRPFVIEFMPAVASRLTYWLLDIGNVRRMLELGGRADLVDLPTDVEAKPHRGLGDVELHVAEARRYLQLLGSLPYAKVDAEV